MKLITLVLLLIWYYNAIQDIILRVRFASIKYTHVLETKLFPDFQKVY